MHSDLNEALNARRAAEERADRLQMEVNRLTEELRQVSYAEYTRITPQSSTTVGHQGSFCHNLMTVFQLFFHWQTQRYICNRVIIIKDPTTAGACGGVVWCSG